MTGRGALRFWLLWTATSAAGYGAGLICGYFVGIAAALAVGVTNDFVLSVLAFVTLAPLLGGAVVGIGVGLPQAQLLWSSGHEQWHWIRKSMLGWGVGMALGSPLVLFESLGFLDVKVTWWVRLSAMALCTGLGAGAFQRPLLRERACRASVWIAGNASAVLAAWLVVFASGFPGAPEIVLGGLTYGAISGLAMLWLLRGDQAAPEDAAPVSPEGSMMGGDGGRET